MNPTLEKNLIEDLEKSGFPSELHAIKTFLSCGWGCTGFANYFDLDEEKIRAVDLRAFNRKVERLSNGMKVGTEFIIDAEVKKSEKPWIVFKEKNENAFDDYINNLTHFYNLKPPFMVKKAMQQHSLYIQLGWRGYGIYESFRKPNEPSRSYPALITVCKSVEHTLNTYSVGYKESEQLSKESEEQLDERILLLVKPIIILDGILVTASLSDTGRISLEEVRFAPLEFFYQSKNCRKGIYLVDLVTLNSLREYIEIYRNRQEAILERIKEITLKTAT
jgi:hypothetical protein